MAPSNLELPRWPTERLADAPDTTPNLAVAGSASPGIVGWTSPAWSLESSGLNAIMSPAAIAEIDFSGNAPKQVLGQNLAGDNQSSGMDQSEAQSGTAGFGNNKSESTLTYDGSAHQLTLERSDGVSQTFPANNNVDSRSRGRWSDGTYGYRAHRTHAPIEDSVDGKYGSNGGFEFSVPGHNGMEVHSGRENRMDGLGRKGVDHATFGCIRTNDAGTQAIRDAIAAGYPVKAITVRNNR